MNSFESSADITQRGPSAGSTATLEDIDIRAALDARPPRSPRHERENAALASLAAEMSEHPHNMLQKLAEVALDLCQADSAGISLLDDDVFRWDATAGAFASARGGTMPRTASPCGVCIDQNTTQLMHLPDRCFPALTADPRVVEALLVPFHNHGMPIGTVWVVAHSFDRTFDREDERIVRVLAEFASAGWQLWKSSELAIETSRKKDVFLATLGHELRNPLAAIGAAASNLSLRLAEDTRARRAIDIIRHQSSHVSRLIDDLRDAAQTGLRTLELHTTSVDLQSIILETVESQRSQLEQYQHHLTTELGAEPVVIEADPVRLAQMISNLLDNAAKYTPIGGHIGIAMTNTATDVRIAVSDNGGGIPADQWSAVFEPFTRLREGHDASPGGLGLGLALVRNLANLHGGTVSVTSDGPGRGSCFTIRLPHSIGQTVSERSERPPLERLG